MTSLTEEDKELIEARLTVRDLASRRLPKPPKTNYFIVILLIVLLVTIIGVGWFYKASLINGFQKMKEKYTSKKKTEKKPLSLVKKEGRGLEEAVITIDDV